MSKFLLVVVKFINFYTLITTQVFILDLIYIQLLLLIRHMVIFADRNSRTRKNKYEFNNLN
jgi:hypothetical protein